MKEENIEEKTMVDAKELRNIKYSLRFLKDQEKPQVIVKEFRNEEGKHIGTIILKYNTPNGIQEVIMGTLSDISDAKENVIKIIENIEKQLEENMISESEYSYYEEILQYIQQQKVPFEFTVEGLEILACKSKETITIPRTVFEDTQGIIESFIPKDAFEKRNKEQSREINEYMKYQKVIGRWNENRDKVLDTIELSIEKEKFLQGEKITQSIAAVEDPIRNTPQAISKRNQCRQEIVADYLKEVYDKQDIDISEIDDKNAARIRLLKGYLKIKEKGLAIDANIALDIYEKDIYDEIEQQGDVTDEISQKLNEIQNYKQFFNLIKLGRDWNARIFALKLGKIDFKALENILQEKKCKDEELLNYIKIKEKMVNETQTDNLENKKLQYSSVRKLDEFLLSSSIRNKTKEDDEHIASGIYEQAKKELIKANFDELGVYNYYAEKYKVFTCPVPAKKMNFAELSEEEKKQEDSKKKIDRLYDDIFANLGIDMNNSDKNSPDEDQR